LFAIFFLPPLILPKIAPTVGQLVGELLLCLFLFDFIYFIWHYLHHKFNFLYQNCHEFHHQYRKPFALVTQHLHWSELLATTLMTVGVPELLGCHILTYWIWIQTSIFISVDAHTGYDFPISLNNWIPFYGGALTHDYHHLHPKTNFQPFFTYLDKLFGTDFDPKKIKNKI
jgi:sterol desaturase/sphingolipid hydroxylase (fatty acid hydroxylase superfamily)